MVLRKLKVKSREPDGRSQNCYFLGGAKEHQSWTRKLTTHRQRAKADKLQ
jgi:hypothetical protein